MGSKTDNPCTNLATTEDYTGVPLCEAHAQIVDLGRQADSYHVAEQLLVEGVQKLEELGGGPAVTLLEHALEDARKEIDRLDRKRAELDPRS
jgi:hypothetical protein